MTKYDAKKPTPYDERQRTRTAAETAARQAAREKQRQRLREAQAKANATSKYHNRKTVRLINGKRELFDSKREAYRWDELMLLQRAGKISGLERQKRYRLIPAQYGPDGKLIEKPCDYIADFVYRKDGRVVVEDAKGRKTDAYIIKRKLMLQKYGIRIVEV